MKKLLPIYVLIAAGCLNGCAWFRHQPAAGPAKPAPPAATQMIVTPDESLAAKVVSVNTVGRFVVLNFSEGQVPKAEQHFFLYRAGLKAAEVKIDGAPADTLIVADILSGDAQVGDTVRDQ
jgi:hypothetical protein